MTRVFELNTGAKIPSVGMGTYKASPGAAQDALISAAKIGYRHIDCASMYNNQEEVGLALKKMFEEGIVKREDLFITSKLWCDDHAPEDVLLALDKTLKELQTDYMDLYLIHWPIWVRKGSDVKPENIIPLDLPGTQGAMEKLHDLGKARAIGVSNFSIMKLEDLLAVARVPPAVNQIHWPIRVRKGSDIKPENIIPLDLPGTWGAMEKLHDIGKARAIGVSNFSIKKLEDLLAIARVPPAVNQVECHPAWQQTKLHTFCQEKGIYLSAYCPLSSPGTKSINVLTNPALNLVAEKLGKSPAQIALRWGIQMGHCVLPKSTNEARMKENIDLFDWSIPEDLLPMFSEIKQVRLVTGEFAVHPNGVYKSLEELWDE